MIFYSPSTKGLYIQGISDVIPVDAIQVSQGLYDHLLEQQELGYEIVYSAGILHAELPTVSQDSVDMSNSITYLADTEWYVLRTIETGEPIPSDVVLGRASANAVIGHV
jgi:membrane protease subunit (stomatin/prohibitin family)